MPLDPSTPVLVGVAAITDPADPPEAVELMAHAAVAAARDAGAPSLLPAVQQIAVPKGTWGYTDPGRLVAERVGAAGAVTVLAEIGIPQQTLVSDALRRIRDGEIDVALVTGGEAKRRAARGGAETNQGGAAPDVHLVPDGELVARPEIAARVWEPVQQYALIDNALRAAEGRSIAAHQADIDALWARFAAVAGRADVDDAFLRTRSPSNRPLAFPYNKWHSTQWTVDQAAALLLCSAAAAEAHGVPRDRWVFPRVALESSFALSLSRRRDLHRWPAMRVLGEAAAAHLGRPLADVDVVELYSCFPAAVRVQQRELGLPLDGTPTVTGGMAFAGGPFNNFTYQATAAVIARLRQAGGGLGLVTTVSGLLTKPGLAVWSPEPGPLLVDDLAGPARAATAEAPLAADGYEGPATVATYTVTYDGLDPAGVVAVTATPAGERVVATCADATLAAQAERDDLVGAAVRVAGTRLLP